MTVEEEANKMIGDDDYKYAYDLRSSMESGTNSVYILNNGWTVIGVWWYRSFSADLILDKDGKALYGGEDLPPNKYNGAAFGLPPYLEIKI